MQSSDASHLFQTEASLAQGRTRAAKARRTAHGARYGRPIWLGANDGSTAPSSSSRSGQGPVGVSLSAPDEAAADAPSTPEQQPFVSVAGKDESAGASFDGGKTRVLGALLDPTPDGGNAHLITAESGALLRRVDLESGLVVQVFRGHTAPVIALASLDVTRTPATTSRRRVLFSAGWDRSIRAWPMYDAPASSALPGKVSTPLVQHADAASDFIKALLVVPSASHPVLLSGGSDRTIRIWSLFRLQQAVQDLDEDTWRDPVKAGAAVTTALASDGTKSVMDLLGTFSEHTRPITALTMLPSRPDRPCNQAESAPVLFSADSLGRIAQLELELTASAGSSPPTSARLRPIRELKGNEGSVSSLHAGWVRAESEEQDEDNEGHVQWEATLWAASRDRAALAYTVVSGPTSHRHRRTAPAPPKILTGRNALQFGAGEPLWPDRTVPHLDYVTAVLDLNATRRPLAHQPSAADSLAHSLTDQTSPPPSIITACSDEQIRLWALQDDLSGRDDGDDEHGTNVSAKVFDIHGQAAVDSSRPFGASPKGEVEAHWHEISFLGAWWRSPPSAASTSDSVSRGNGGQWWVVSASYDGSVRRWSLEDLVRLAASSQAKDTDTTTKVGSTVTTDTNGDHQVTSQDAAKPSTGNIQFTAEEEAELAELMDSDED